MTKGASALIVPMKDMYEPFPEIDSLHEPTGHDVLVQLRTPMERSAGGVIIAKESRDIELWNNQVAVIRAVGPVAYRNRETLNPWPEGAWCKVGDYVRVPKYGGERWMVKVTPTKEALFALFRDTEIRARVTGDPTAVSPFA